MCKKPRAVKGFHIEMLTSLLVPFVNSNVTFGKEDNRASCQKNATQVLFIPFAFCDKNVTCRMCQ